MISYRITKYDPKKRDENGAYTDSKGWISVSDIGKSEYSNPTFNQYYEIETGKQIIKKLKKGDNIV